MGCVRFGATRPANGSDEGAVEGITAEVRTIVEDARGELWLGTPISGVFRVTFAQGAAGQRGAATVAHSSRRKACRKVTTGRA